MWFASHIPKRKILPLVTEIAEVPTPCDPALILGLDDFENLDELLLYDLLFSKTSTFRSFFSKPSLAKNDTLLCEIYSFLMKKDLIHLAKASHSTYFISGQDLYGENRDSMLDSNRNKTFRCILTADYCVSEEESTEALFIKDQFNRGVAVTIMALEGLFNMGPINRLFGVDWTLIAYTKCFLELTDIGRIILGDKAFPEPKVYTKAHFVVGSGHSLFKEYIDYSYYENDSDEDEAPKPMQGTPVMSYTDDTKCVSYFGFVNPLDISYGAILNRLSCARSFLDNDTFFDAVEDE